MRSTFRTKNGYESKLTRQALIERLGYFEDTAKNVALYVPGDIIYVMYPQWYGANLSFLAYVAKCEVVGIANRPRSPIDHLRYNVAILEEPKEVTEFLAETRRRHQNGDEEGWKTNPAWIALSYADAKNCYETEYAAQQAVDHYTAVTQQSIDDRELVKRLEEAYAEKRLTWNCVTGEHQQKILRSFLQSRRKQIVYNLNNWQYYRLRNNLQRLQHMVKWRRGELSPANNISYHDWQIAGYLKDYQEILERTLDDIAKFNATTDTFKLRKRLSLEDTGRSDDDTLFAQRDKIVAEFKEVFQAILCEDFK